MRETSLEYVFELFGRFITEALFSLLIFAFILIIVFIPFSWIGVFMRDNSINSLYGAISVTRAFRLPTDYDIGMGDVYITPEGVIIERKTVEVSHVQKLGCNLYEEILGRLGVKVSILKCGEAEHILVKFLETDANLKEGVVLKGEGVFQPEIYLPKH